MGSVYSKIKFDCQCHSMCNAESHFIVEHCNAGYVTIYQKFNCELEPKLEKIGVYSHDSIRALVKVLTSEVDMEEVDDNDRVELKEVRGW